VILAPFDKELNVFWIDIFRVLFVLVLVICHCPENGIIPCTVPDIGRPYCTAQEEEGHVNLASSRAMELDRSRGFDLFLDYDYWSLVFPDMRIHLSS